MHHPEISTIVQILDDYFLMFDPKSTTTIRGGKIGCGNSNSLCITRELRNGRLDIVINSDYEDDNDVVLSYHQHGSKNEHDGQESIESDDFNLENISRSIRSMILYDRDAEPRSKNDLVLGSNNRS